MFQIEVAPIRDDTLSTNILASMTSLVPCLSTPLSQDQAIQVLSESLRPENEILHRTLDELEKAQADNARLLRERGVASPNLTREALRRSRDRVAELEVH